MSIGMNIRHLRQKVGLSQNKLANMIGVSQSAIANYEKGLRQPSLEGLILLANFFEVTTDQLLGLDEKIDREIDSACPIQMVDYFLNEMLAGRYETCFEFAYKYRRTYGYLELYFSLFRGVMTKIGWLWETGYISAAEEHILTSNLENLLQKMCRVEKVDSLKSYILTTIHGERHTFGLLMLSYWMKGEGIDNTYLGEGVPLEECLNLVNKRKGSELVISISSVLFFEELDKWMNTFNSTRIHVIGYGIRGKKSPHRLITYYESYKDFIKREMESMDD